MKYIVIAFYYYYTLFQLLLYLLSNISTYFKYYFKNFSIMKYKIVPQIINFPIYYFPKYCSSFN